MSAAVIVSASQRQPHGALSAARRRAKPGAVVALLLAAGFLQAGCSSPAPEARLEAAGEALDSSAAELAEVNERIAETETTLVALRKARRALKDEVRTLEQRLAARATDVAVFRAVQGALLEDKALQSAAIAVTVEDGVATLGGRVQSQDQRRRAIAVATGIAGVDSVVSQVVVDEPAAAPRNTADGTKPS